MYNNFLITKPIKVDLFNTVLDIAERFSFELNCF